MMKRILTAILLALSSPALAQEMDHSQHQGHPHGMPPSDNADAPPTDHGQHDVQSPSAHGTGSATHAAPMDHSQHHGHQQGASPAGNAAAPVVDHSQHNMPDHNGHAPAPAGPASSMDHSGHVTPGGHDHGTAPVDPPKRPVDPKALSGSANAADRVYGPEVMARARANMLREHGAMTIAKLMLDRLEARVVDGEDGYAWEGDFWVGNDDNKLWIKSEGEGAFDGDVEQAEVQALWSRPVGPWFDLQIGARHDFRPRPQRTHAVVAVQGLLPYWLETSGSLFLSDKGDLTARAEVEYDLRITPRLILQPRLEANLAAQNIPELGVGAGLSDAELGVRLRYHVSPQLAPYAGVEWENAFGRTRRYLRAEGEDPSRVALVMGVRFWF